MERLKAIKETLIGNIQAQMGNLQNVDAKELGEAMDMVKDIEEAIYYCTITEAMKKKDENKETYYYTERYLPPYIMEGRDVDRGWGKMYYDDWYDRMYYDNGSGGRTSGSPSNGGAQSNRQGMYGYDSMTNGYNAMPSMMRDAREGRSPMTRRTYMEAKEMHKGTAAQMKELENYMKELSTDITDMIKDASPEEKVMLQQKLTTLANKIS